MSEPEPQQYEPQSHEPQQFEPPPSVGKLLVWILVFVLAAVVVVLGGVYLT
ncbi:hypothetical protein SAMN04487983_100468 [Streptomyces sp. yr375]|uniref:hypothetical protein n=1 Tax=Streptomyces sp. yr375 TaxID=1761906 RepID=UPI0008C66430|nr:hypothetical protein [Streptomyces sp. yr375]SEQ28693.1 hypothetical protein SAMN04487983_100468 [Streptomyces sp. yr375]